MPIRSYQYQFPPQVVDVNGLHAMIGAAIFEMIKRKPQPFKDATLNKKAYLEVPAWKRAMIYVFLVRFLLKKKHQQRWMNYNASDYKLNVRSFRRYMLQDAVIIEKTKAFLVLPVNEQAMTEEARKNAARRKKKRKPSQMTSNTESEVVMNLDFSVQSSSEEETVVPANTIAQPPEQPRKKKNRKKKQFHDDLSEDESGDENKTTSDDNESFHSDSSESV